mgnify:CR=1 FL=1
MNPDVVQAAAADPLYSRYFDALLAGDGEQCRQVVEAWLERDPDLRGLYEGLFRRALYAVGKMWEHGQVSVATEHFATAMTERMLTLVYPRLFSGRHSGKSALVTCAANEHHQVGAKMVADMFEMHGWRCWFLGAATPLQEILDLIGDKRPDVVALSLTLYFNADALYAMAEAIRKAFPDQPMLVGGQAFEHGGAERFERMPGMRHMKTLQELGAWIESQEAHVRQ